MAFLEDARMRTPNQVFFGDYSPVALNSRIREIKEFDETDNKNLFKPIRLFKFELYSLP